MRVALLGALVMTLSACDSMIADRILIQAEAQQPEPVPSVSQLLSTAHLALSQCGLSDTDISSYEDTVRWRDPERPPGLHIRVDNAEGGIRVTLEQGLFGPIGRTDPYRCVQKSLRRQLEERFGKENLRFQS